MLIILEGPDGSGKSTLAKALQQETGGDIIHRSAPVEHPLIEYVAPLSGYNGSGTLILDRWHLGEEVYGPLYRGGSRLGPHGFNAVEDVLIELGAVLVFCCGLVTDLQKRLTDRDGTAPPRFQLGRELRAFDDAMRRSRLPKLWSPSRTPVTTFEVINLARSLEPAYA